MEGFEVDRATVEDVVILNLKGYLDAHTSSILDEVLTSLLNDEQYRIVANLEMLEYISSAGLGVFMSYIEQVRKRAGDIKLVNLSSRVYKIFELVGFTRLYEICESTEVALTKF